MAKHWHQSMIMIPFFFIYISQFTFAANSFSSNLQVKCNENDLSALVKFKQSFTTNMSASSNALAYPKLASWKRNGSDCCLWDGVECSKNTGHVIGLHLGSSFLYGPLKSNSSLFNLVHLQTLNLTGNNFMNSQIPSAIGLLSQLRRLDLSFSAFSGQIPKEISWLKHLAFLYLSQNPLKLQNPSFEYLLQNLTGLEELSLSGVNISSHLPDSLTNFSSLRLISLEECGLHGEFPEGIFHLPLLESLRVRYNENLRGFLPEFHKSSQLKILALVGTNFSGMLPVTIGNLKSLVTLDLQNCSFTGSLPASLNNLTKLANLDLSYNQFMGQIPSFASLSQLTYFSLSSNKFNQGNIPNSLGKLLNLEILSLSDTHLYGSIPSSLSNLTNLSFLDLGFNQINGHIPPWLMNLTQLTDIIFTRNQLQGPIPATISSLKDLTYLSLYQNNLSGIVAADTFLDLKKLKSLQLGFNGITLMAQSNQTNASLPQFELLGLQSCNLKGLPEFLRAQNELVDLFINANHIEGQVPEWFWNSSKETLEALSMRDNLLTGFEHYPHILPWVGAHILDFSNNMFHGSLPVPPPNTNIYRFRNNRLTGDMSPSICQVSSLAVLDLSYNNLTGTIPPCFGEMSNSLSMLFLKSNSFSGTIPNTFTKESSLKMIDVGQNQLEGQLPRSLTNCTMLQVLNLADNSLNDIFPTWLENLQDLQVLILSSNKFHGAITTLPKANSVPYPKLRIIDLSNNAFTGDLPQGYIQSWTSMKISDPNAEYLSVVDTIYSQNTWTSNSYFFMTITNKGVKTQYEKVLNVFTVIDLSSNKFTGEIPESIGQLVGLQLLNLSNNNLNGSIPASFANLMNLESLDLSGNKLSGEIPQQLSNLNFLAFLNVSFNNLQGKIPQGEQFDTFQNNSYEGNTELCGEPLSKNCEKFKVPLIVEEDGNDFELVLSGVDWIVLSLGDGSGIVVGLIVGKFLTSRYNEWFVEKFGKRKDKWVRPIGMKRSSYSN